MSGGGAILERRIGVDGVEVFARVREGEGVPVAFVHGNPSHSEEWLPFLERLGRPAVAIDLPGWGRSARPPTSRFDYGMHGLGRFFARCLERLAITRYALVVHDWGSVALIAAQQGPAAVERLVIVNALPLLPGYRWHWVARWLWRRRGLGELANLIASKPALRLVSRQASARRGPLPASFIDSIWECWPRGTWPQQLALYRSGDPGALAAAGGGLARLDCPALVVWGQDDPYLPPEFGRLYAERLPAAGLVEVEGAGHWPWLERPDVTRWVVDFLESRGPAWRQPERG